ncbi:hypothetical protein SEA_UNTPL_46 [Streptomyces phage UNTPL]|nr:hypothetical protein SEA_UNTPL_46 [Streptomyces phage UNTPL]
MPKLSKARLAAKLGEAHRSEDRAMAEVGAPGDWEDDRVKAADLHHIPIVMPRVNDEDMTVLAVDPGEEHVGVALGCRYFFDAAGYAEFCALCASGEHPKQQHRSPDWKLQAPGWRVYDVAELTPWEFVLFLRENLHLLDWITCEKFTLYPHLAKEQIGSEMPTSKLIGWIEFSVRLWNEQWTKDPSTPAAGRPEVYYESYPANIHKGTYAVLAHAGIDFISPKTPDHARSAELHLWHSLIRAGLVEGVTLA